jgi:hypothetical protein
LLVFSFFLGTPLLPLASPNLQLTPSTRHPQVILSAPVLSIHASKCLVYQAGIWPDKGWCNYSVKQFSLWSTTRLICFIFPQDFSLLTWSHFFLASVTYSWQLRLKSSPEDNVVPMQPRYGESHTLYVQKKLLTQHLILYYFYSFVCSKYYTRFVIYLYKLVISRTKD